MTLLVAMLVTNISQTVVYAADTAEEVVEENTEVEEETSVEKNDESTESEDVLEESSEEITETEVETEETEDSEEDVAEEEVTEEILVSTELSENISDYVIKAEGMMPENAELSVKEIESVEYIEKTVNGSISDETQYHVYAAFDIDILVNGEKWQPVDFDEKVRISITGIDFNEEKEGITYEPGDVIEEITEEAVYRVEGDSVTELESTVMDEEIVFDTEHFTVFTVGGVSYNTNSGVCVFDTSKTYTLYSPETHTQFSTDFTTWPAVKIYWFSDTKTLFWDMVDPNPSSTPCIKSSYGCGYGLEGAANAFDVEDYDVETVVFSEGFTLIDRACFKENTTIKHAVFPSTLTTTEAYCFQDCKTLVDVDFTKIKKEFEVDIKAFSGCTNLVSCVLPSTTTTIENCAFDDCSSLETIGNGFPANLNYLGSLVFSDCRSLKLKTTLPDNLEYFMSFRGSGGMKSENIEVTGTLPSKLKMFKCMWNNGATHFAYLRNIRLRGDIPATCESIGSTMFTTFDDEPIESQSYFTRNLSSVEITGANRIPVKYIIEDRVGSATGTLLGSNEYLGFVGLDYNISDHMTKWNDTETISYAGYEVKDNTAVVTPVIDAVGTVAKGVRIWQASEKYFYLKVFRNGIAEELEDTVTLVDTSEAHPLTLNTEYTGNGIYKVSYNPAELTAKNYDYKLYVYIGENKARDMYNRRLFDGYYKQGAAVSLSPVGSWYEACYFTHLDEATNARTYNLEEITNAKKVSEIDLDAIRAIDYDASTSQGYLVNYFTSNVSLYPMENMYYYVDYQDWAFIVDANTGEFADGSTQKVVQFHGKDREGTYIYGPPEEPTKEDWIFADWESHTLNNPILPDWYGSGMSSDDIVEWAYNPYTGNTHDISLEKIGDHLEDLAFKHYLEPGIEKLCSGDDIVIRYAKYRPIITFDANGGTYANGQDKVTTSLVTTSSNFNYLDLTGIKNPTREGYTFTGYDPDDKFLDGRTLFNDREGSETPQYYKAQWTLNKVYIFFNQNGGSYVATQAVDWGTKATKPEDPVRSGYTFMGWYTDSTYTTPVDWNNDTYKSNTTLYPLYKAKPFVSFYSNGGSTVGSTYVEYMEKLAKPADPTKPGYTFDKWYKDDALTEEYDFDTVLTEDLNLYAGWKANTYTITYDYDGGSVGTANRTSYTPTDNDFTLSDAKKTHYTFRGYTVTNDVPGGFTITVPRGNLTIPKGTYGNLSVKAEYTELPTYTVTFDLGYDGSTPFTETVYYGDELTWPDDPVREGYFFKCWKNSNGTEVVKNKVTVTGNLSYTAVWIKSYAITFDANGGTFTNGASAITLYTNIDGCVSYIPAPSKPAWEPTGGWFRTKDATSGVKYTTRTNFSLWEEDITIYAQYNRKVFSINYVLDGGKTDSQLYTGYDGSQEVEIPDDVEKEGYYFIGWTIENDCADGGTYSVDEPQKEIVIPKDIFGNLTVRAHYIKKYDVTLNANGGKFKDGKGIKHVITDAEGKIVLPEDPTKEGHTFKGWEIDGKKYNPDEDVITEDTELIAKWELNKVEITFVSNGEVIETKTYNYGDTVTAPNVTREGRTFTGWKPTFVGVAKNDTTYEANWRVNTYRIKFIDHNGKVLSNKTYTYGSKIDMPKDPTRTGYKFIGYSPEVETVCTKNAEYRATYGIMTYTVIFTDYDGKEISKNTYTYGDEIAVPASPNREGYMFAGWDKPVGKTATEDVTYKATYNKFEVTYTVTFIDQNGYVINSRDYRKGEEIYVPEAPDRKGYEFSGWSPKVRKTCDGAATYRATYEKEESDEPETKTYLITFAGYNGQIISSGNYKEGESITIPNAPEVEGYNFRSWYPTVEAKATKSVTYTAVYDAKPTKIEGPTPKPEKKKEEKEEEQIEEPEEEKPSDNEKPDEIPKKEKFTVVFKDDEGKVISRKVYNEGDEIEIPTAPEKEGYTFEGWSPKISKKADKNTEYKTIYKKNEVKEPENPKEEKKPLSISPMVKSLVAGAACVGILTAGYFSGVWLLLLNLLFIGKRKKWKGILTEEDNKYVKAVKNLDDEEPYIPAIFDEAEGDVNSFTDSVSVLKSYTVLPLGTKMFVTLSDAKGSDVRSFDSADEDRFYDILGDNLSQDTRVVLSLVNERCDVNIEIEFNISKKSIDSDNSDIEEQKPAWKKETDGDLEFLDEEDLPDYS